MAHIRIKVGASLDASTNTVFQPLEKAAARARSKIEKDLDRAAKEATKIEAASQKAGEKLERELEQMANKILRDEEKSQRERTRIVEREAKERARLEQQAAKEAERAAAQVTRVQERESAQADTRWRRNVGRALGMSLRLIRGGASLAMGGAEELLQGVGVDLSVASHMGNAVALQQRIADVTNAGYIPGAAGAQGVLQNQGDVAKDVKAAANAGAYDYEAAAVGLQKFVGLTGDLETGRATLAELAKLSRATGSNIEDMAAAAAEVSNNLGDVPDRAKAVDDVMRVIGGQGKLGAVEIKDLARQMAKIATQASKFEGGAAGNIGDLGILAQEAKLRGGAASATQAATSVVSFASDITKATTLKHWAAASRTPFTDATHTTLQAPEEIILRALEYSKGDITKLNQLFPNRQSMRAVQGFATIYSETKGTDKQKADAVAAEFDRLRQAQLDEITVQQALADAMDTTKSKVQLANNRLDDMAGQIQAAMLPAIAGLVPAIEALTPSVVSLTTAFADALGSLTQSTSLEEQKGALKGQVDATNFIGTMHAFERSNMAPSPGPRSDAMVDISMQRAAPFLAVEAKKESELTDSIGAAENELRKDKGKFGKDSDETIAKIAAGMWSVGPGMQAAASKYMADKATLERLHSVLDTLQTERAGMVEAITSGRMRVTVVNMPSSAPAAPPAPTPGGSMPADSD